MATTWTTPETNLIKAEDLVKAREVLYTYRFQDDLRKLFEAMGVTRKIAKQQGTYLKAYKVTGRLEDGNVAEGELIPLSKYITQPVAFEEIKLNKWRKATSAEAIMERGYDQAHDETLGQLLKDAQNGIKKQFFDFLMTGTGRAQGATFQSAIAQAWGQLQILFEDTDVQSVYFMNPRDIADFLGTSNAIVPQTVFGMKYIQDFIGLGTIIMNSNVPVGKIAATAKENIVCYYLPVGGNIFGPQLTFTTDPTGYIGIHTGGIYGNMTDEDVVVSGIRLFAERQDGIIISTIGEEQEESITLNKATANIAVGNTETLTATTVPADATVTWASSDTDVATVAGGVVTGVANGTVTITATNGSASATCEVTVGTGA